MRGSVGLNVYLHQTPAQVDLLVGCLGPLAVELAAAGRLESWWYTRFDARGPHVTALLVPAPGAADAVEERLAAAIARWQAESDIGEALGGEDLALRHDECRGKTLNPVDAEEGFAPHGSWRLFRHSADGYPFGLAAGAERGEEIWRLSSEQASWAVEQLAHRAGGEAAVAWIGALDGVLAAHAAAAWRRHAESLLPGLHDRLVSDEAGVLRGLPGLVGERNRRLFAAGWDSTPPAVERRARRLVAAIGDAGLGEEQRRRLLREVVHVSLLQLALPVRAHLPLVLYAWARSETPTAEESGAA